jgi:deoxyinosine 3'endonuclease (endonuclease V)
MGRLELKLHLHGQLFWIEKYFGVVKAVPTPGLTKRYLTGMKSKEGVQKGVQNLFLKAKT